ncbi:MAG: acetyltransferase, partial [Succinivibrio sp.]
ISNHLSWLDILFIGCVFKGNIPTTKFFMKHSLIYIPFAGLACYALGMPFLHRYPKEKLLKNPKLRTKDIETTKAACKRLITFPTSLINFVEGSRYTKEKAKLSRSPYKYLLPPKVASLGVALGEIVNEIDTIYNITFYYPDNSKKAFVDMLKGRIKNVYVDIGTIEKSDKLQGNYLEDKQFKHDFTMFMRKLWEEKDAVLEKMHQDYEASKNK